MLLGRIHEAWKKKMDSWTINFRLQLSEDIFWEHLLRKDIFGISVTLCDMSKIIQTRQVHTNRKYLVDFTDYAS